MKYNRIAFVGPMRSGKTTAAHSLAPALIISIADGVRDLAADYFDYDLGSPDRSLLQRVGQAMRDVDPEVWLRSAERTWNGISGGIPLVIDDVRYINEVAYLRERDFVIVGIHASKIARERRHGDRVLFNEQSQHISEVSASGIITDNLCDLTIYNDGTLEEHEQRVRELLA